MKTQKNLAVLLAATALLWVAVILASQTAIRVKAPDYGIKIEAAQTMQACMDSIKEYKLANGIPLHALDYKQTGMIGTDFNMLTTTLGDVAAKRTTADANMAAIVVEMLGQAGVKRGDTVGVNFSGSFPAMNIAVLSACHAMGLEVRGYASVGSSTYGANNPEFTFPEMLQLLIEEGKLPEYRLLTTLGGGRDTGGGMDVEMLQTIEARLLQKSIPLLKEPDFAKNLALRMEYFGEITCFISVGGNITSIGRERNISKQGVIYPTENMEKTNQNSGLVEVYHSRGLPVLHLLNIKQLCEEYAYPFDSASVEKIGEAEVYYTVQYNRVVLGVGLGAACLLLLFNKKYWLAKNIKHSMNNI